MTTSSKNSETTKTKRGLVYDFDLLPNCPSILSMTEAALVCNVSVQTISRMIDAGLLAKIPDTDDLLRDDLIAYFTQHTLADKPIL